MNYVACLKTAQNDIKALINLEQCRKEKITPLLELRGRETDKYLSNFLSEWGASKFFLDFCQTENNDDISSWQAEFLRCDNAFSTKKSIFHELTEHKNMIPVISWQDKNNLRNIIQFAIHTENSYPETAIRVNMGSKSSWNVAISLLSALTTPSNLTVILDFRGKPPSTPEEIDLVEAKVCEINEFQIKQIILLSTSFPTEKPPSGETKQISCTDYFWQTKIITKYNDKKIVYGDYAATNPFSIIDFVPGMIVIPFACYFIPFTWWVRRNGTDKEYKVFRSIAKEIVNLPFFHGEDYCWATKEISRIAKLDDTIDGQHGSNGSWNGYKSNQHMCVMLDTLLMPAHSLSEADNLDEE